MKSFLQKTIFRLRENIAKKIIKVNSVVDMIVQETDIIENFRYFRDPV